MFDKVIDVIEKHQRFLISGHMLPDGDCVGAETALFHLLSSMGKKAWILNPDPIPRTYDFLAAHTTFGAWSEGSGLPDFEVHFLVDCHQLTRLGKLGKAVLGKKCVRVVVDHHVGAARGDGDVALVDEDAPATGVLVYDLIRRIGAPLSKEAAEGVFVSIATDTGWFRYSNTNDQALAVAADLAANGVQPSAIYDAIYRRNRPESVELLASALAGSRLLADGRIAVIVLDREFMRRAAAAAFDTDEVMEPLRSLERVEIVVLLKEKADGAVKLSLRSKGRFDVDGVARSFGGGGHRKASGAEIPGAIVEAEAAVLERVRELIGVPE